MDELLEPVGLGALESALYVRLLAAPRSSADDLAVATGLPAAELTGALTRLTEHALITRLAGTPARYVPAPPDLAIDALALRRQEALERLRARARDLTRGMAAIPRGNATDLIELIEGDQAVLHQLARIQLAAEREVTIIDCPPYLMGQPIANDEQTQAMNRGIRYRAIYHAPLLAEPTKLQNVLQCMALGEDARALPDIHLKMIIVDQRVAVIPLSFGGAETKVRILIHQSPLLSVLVMLFDLLWDKATPVGARPAPDGPSPRDRELLMMLAAGMKDRAMARALGVTERTVTRRITLLMEGLGAATRFQAALQAAHRGWL
ncbi:transcriptional regulator [Pilimelia anulata]|uniref:Transcriptional regulator n=1 Tax=Pilimelia anulata TaxID=53371 RepID=A0A8J3FCV7_9ACTN|nr:LuxR family transcriptional regulator [Pilimelia anulata]GGK07417.1 transcriptional regulator [Pilimelia anulata]